jgi:hypothetical protein
MRMTGVKYRLFAKTVRIEIASINKSVDAKSRRFACSASDDPAHTREPSGRADQRMQQCGAEGRLPAFSS